MATFRYRALSPAGDMVEGDIEAPDAVRAIARLNERALLPIQAVEKGASSRFTLSLGPGGPFGPGRSRLVHPAACAPSGG